MQAAFIERYGRTDVLQVGERPKPTPAPDQVLVKVKAASINPRDWLLMRGIYPFKKLAEPFPIVLGSDMAGTIVALGDQVTSYAVGDDVFGMQPARDKFGAFAEYVAIKASAVALKPADISHADAAAMPCAGLTSFQTVRDLAKLQPGEHILINGASGGVGSYAVQMAKAAGAHVTAVAGPDNQGLCKQLGADETLDYKQENFENHQDRYNVVYDVIGRSSPKKCRKCLKKGGRYISTIPSPSLFLQAKLSKFTAALGMNKRQTTDLILVAPKGEDLSEMATMMLDSTLKSLIDSTFPLSEAPAAFEKSQSWRAKGKIIITMA